MFPTGVDPMDPGAKVPVILNVHGGPHTQYGETYFDEAQVQAAAGFAVLMSNPRGSTGREEAWGKRSLAPSIRADPAPAGGQLVLRMYSASLMQHCFSSRPAMPAELACKVVPMEGSWRAY
jgi:hypothetical protein